MLALQAVAGLFIRCSRFEDHSRGATALEYGLMVALIAAVIFATVVAFGSGVGDLFNGSLEKIVAAIH